MVLGSKCEPGFGARKGGCELPYTRIKLTDRDANINFGKHGASFWEAGFLITTFGWLTDT